MEIKEERGEKGWGGKTTEKKTKEETGESNQEETRGRSKGVIRGGDQEFGKRRRL